MAQIALNKPSGGQLLIEPEDGTSTETVTIPSGGVMAANAVTGKVLQMKQTSLSSTLNIATDSWTQIPNGIITLTPVSQNSVFIVHACCHAYTSNGGTSGVWSSLNLRVLRSNAVDLGGYRIDDPYMDAIRDPVNNEAMHRPVISLADAPNTTSEITYNLQGMSKNSRQMQMNNFSYGFIQVWEVAN